MIRYDFTKYAEKSFLKLPTVVQKRIIEKIEFFLSDSNPLSFAKPLSGASSLTYRFRIGDYRVIFDWEGKAYGGHLMPGSVVFAAEYNIQEYSGGELRRIKDAVTGLPLWGQGGRVVGE
jgi:mRNA-degrading endonuclease RelE of RelBE toxin-antitoxin system